MVAHSCARPWAIASGTLRRLDGESGVKKNSGRLNTTKQIAASTPTARSGSCRALSRPNSGCGFHDQASRKNRKVRMPMALPRLKPRPLSQPSLPEGAMLGSRAFTKTLQYSKMIWATISGTITCIIPVVMAGAAHQVAIMQGAPTTRQNTSQGLRRPPASPMAPRIGAVRAMISEEIEVTKLQVSWPFTGLVITTVEK